MDNIIPKRIKEIEAELDAIRGQSTLYTENSPGRSEALQRIATLEARLARLQETSTAINKLLAAHGAKTIRELTFLKSDTENTLNATGNRIWQELLFIRGAGKYGPGDRTRWLPSDLIKVGDFPKLEAEARKEIVAAEKALPTITADLSKISAFVEEALKT